MANTYVSEADRALVEIDGLLCRNWTEDHTTAEQIAWCAELGITPDDVVLDIGARIGHFTKMAQDAGAKRIIAVEEDPENCALLRRNCWYGHTEVVNLAVMREAKNVTLYRSPTNPKAHSLYVKGGKRIPLTIASVPFTQLLTGYEPTLIRIDGEGTEHEMGLDQPLPDYVRGLALEIHIDPGNRKRGAPWRESAERIVDCLTASGFTPTKPVDLDEVRWVKVPGGAYPTQRIERVWLR